MILDHINNINLYTNIDSNLALGLKYIQETDFTKLEKGNYTIKGKEIFAILQSYNSKPESECRLEAHEKYVDIQYIIRGEEYIGVSPLNNQSILEDLPDNDVTFYKGVGEKIKVSENHFAVFFQTDVHAPCIQIEKSKEVLKVVIKVALSN